jgi:hypothetical protein
MREATSVIQAECEDSQASFSVKKIFNNGNKHFPHLDIEKCKCRQKVV